MHTRALSSSSSCVITAAVTAALQQQWCSCSSSSTAPSANMPRQTAEHMCRSSSTVVLHNSSRLPSAAAWPPFRCKYCLRVQHTSTAVLSSAHWLHSGVAEYHKRTVRLCLWHRQTGSTGRAAAADDDQSYPQRCAGAAALQQQCCDRRKPCALKFRGLRPGRGVTDNLSS